MVDRWRYILRRKRYTEDMNRSLIPLFAVMLLSVGILLGVASPSHAETTSTSSASEPLIMRMSDGRFYHPASGLIAATREELLVRIQAPSASSTPPVVVEVPLPPPPVPVSPPSAIEAPPVVLAARRAKVLLLADQKPTHTLTKKPSDWREVTLAVWNSLNDEVRLITIEKNGTSVRNVSASDIGVSFRGGAGYDTDYRVTPETSMVVGVRYPIIETVTQKVKRKKVTSYKAHEMVYVPYGQSVHTEAVVHWGKIVLDKLVATALSEARAKQVMSKAFPGKLLADAADPVALKSIMAIEHLDHASVGRGADDRLELFYVELALNEGDAFHQDVSSAGANGLLQFIPSTYASVVKRWPQLSLVSDFHEGMGNLPNAIKAGIAYLDDVWSDLPAQARDPKVTSPESMRAYLIAAYNTGGIRVRRAINRFGDAWDKDYRKDWERLDAKQTDLAMTVHRLKNKLKKEKVAATKKKLTRELATAQADYANVTDDLDALDRSRLKSETISYLLKYRLVAPRMKVSEIAMN